MNGLKFFIVIVLITFLSCNNSNHDPSHNHGHDHGPNGEHLHDHGVQGHTHDTHHKQEVFELEKDSLKIDTIQ